MSVSREYQTYVLEQLGALGHPRSKPMFGGVGLYVDDHFMALIADDELYFKVDDDNREAFLAAGSEPFTFTFKDGRSGEMSYYRAPEACFDDPDEFAHYARLGLDAALRAKK